MLKMTSPIMLLWAGFVRCSEDNYVFVYFQDCKEPRAKSMYFKTCSRCKFIGHIAKVCFVYLVIFYFYFLFMYLFTHSFYLSVFPFIYLFIFPFIYLFILFVYLFSFITKTLWIFYICSNTINYLPVWHEHSFILGWFPP